MTSTKRKSAGGAKALPSIGKVVGRKYSKRVEVAEGIEQIDPDATMKLKQRKFDAIQMLEKAGIPATQLLAQAPGGSFLQERVIHVEDHPHDSPLGLAAQICYACCQLELWIERFGAPPAHPLTTAFRLGRLTVLAKAYGLDDQESADFRDAGTRARTTYTKEVKAMWREDRKLLKGHSDRRAAELIVAKRELPLEATETVRKAIAAKKTGKSL